MVVTNLNCIVFGNTSVKCLKKAYLVLKSVNSLEYKIILDQ